MTHPLHRDAQHKPPYSKQPSTRLPWHHVIVGKPNYPLQHRTPFTRKPIEKRPHLTSIEVLGGPASTTSNNPPWARKKHPLPNQRSSEMLPIIYGQPSSPNLVAYQIMYLDENGQVQTDCLLEVVANQIPRNRIFASSLTPSGAYRSLCPAENAMSYTQMNF